MRSIIILLFLFSSINVLAQKTYPSIKEVVVQDKIIHASIDGKHDITIYLQLHKFSEDHGGFYSVKGWYHYDKYKKQIPIVGVYDGGLYLYVIKDAKTRDKILNFSSSTGDYWHDLEFYKNAKEYKERFVFTDDEKNTWTNHQKKFSIDQYGKLEVYTKKYFLCWDKTHFFDLENIGIWRGDVMIKTVNDNRVLLSYEFSSNLRVNGRCGAGSEAGYKLLIFDKSKSLRSFDDYRVESCYKGIYSETEEKDGKVFIISDLNEKEVAKKLIIDLDRVVVTEE